MDLPSLASEVHHKETWPKLDRCTAAKYKFWNDTWRYLLHQHPPYRVMTSRRTASWRHSLLRHDVMRHIYAV